jgi:hypothetical protein
MPSALPALDGPAALYRAFRLQNGWQSGIGLEVCARDNSFAVRVSRLSRDGGAALRPSVPRRIIPVHARQANQAESDQPRSPDTRL